jgi:hypothetical protein
VESCIEQIYTRIAVTGFQESEIADGLPHLLRYLSERPWLLNPKATWDAEGNRLIVEVGTEEIGSDVASEFAFDEIWDCVIAAINFSSDKIHFDILET